MFKSADDESEESLYKHGAKKRGFYESDATSTDSKKEVPEIKREFKISYKKTTFKEKGQQQVVVSEGRVTPSRERPPLAPCEPLLLSPKVKHLCWCKMPLPPPKPRCAPLVCLLLFYFQRNLHLKMKDTFKV